MSQPSFVIVIGASAGGLDAIGELVAQFPDTIDAAIFVVLHLSKIGMGDFLCRRIERYSSLPCHVATEGKKISKGNIYVAPADFHLIVREGSMSITTGPSENRWRPSIDVLFRSAAVTYRERTIGIVLTGLLDDGTSGMESIRKCGGTTIVQDPKEAEYPDMPQSVIDNMQVDYCLPLQNMGFIIEDVIAHKQIQNIPVPPEIMAEAVISERVATGIDNMNKLGSVSPYSCPDCGGNLWELNSGDFVRYRCQIGHMYSQSDLLKKQSEETESSLWVAVRLMEERKNLLNKIGNEESKKGLNIIASTHLARAKELEDHIGHLKGFLFKTKTD